ncbi:hypothetical protein [Mesorhizobium sp. M1378]|uniref:hypothetical protein n=1 Tax=Mesorhizobium sp. M1378 TaxID=2957092 RepID=UPI00333693E1
MSIKKVVLLTLIICAFGVSFLTVIVVRRINPNAQFAKPSAALEPFSGKLVIRSLSDFRIDGRKIVLCGVTYSKPQAIRAMVEESARQAYQGLALNCRPVGMGTPCDGNVSPKFRDAIVVQCITSDGADLATKLVEDGILCGQPAQANSTYKSCPPGS